MIYPTDLVLIAVLNNRRDFEVIRLLGWYRIPLRFAPKIVDVDAIAFYQTARFKEEKWSIRFAARVQGVELVKRVDLFRDEEDHPRAQEEYYKLQLGPLETLPRTITARSWKRLTFVYTTGERLMNAAEISDLVISEPDRESLWRALRDRAHPAAGNDGSPDVLQWPDALEAFFESSKNTKPVLDRDGPGGNLKETNK
ncbi:MAG: hypothetical protein WBM17_04340 [Anaerolineales bacterium]